MERGRRERKKGERDGERGERKGERKGGRDVERGKRHRGMERREGWREGSKEGERGMEGGERGMREVGGWGGMEGGSWRWKGAGPADEWAGLRMWGRARETHQQKGKVIRTHERKSEEVVPHVGRRVVFDQSHAAFNSFKIKACLCIE